MHHVRALVLFCGALASSVACMRTVYSDTEKTSVVQTTGASAAAQPDPTLNEMAARLAGQICGREVQCHDDKARAEPCWNAYLGRLQVELATWECSPAATRARVKECVAAIRAEPCVMDLATRPHLCGESSKCPDPDAKLVPPGKLLGESGP